MSNSTGPSRAGSYLGGGDTRVALVTGAGRGIGRAMAIGLGTRGCTVWCLSRSEKELQDTATAVTDAGGRGVPRAGDVTDLNAMSALIAEISRESKRLDIVIANAGTNLDRNRIESSNPEGFRATIETNLFGVYNIAKPSIPLLKKSGGGHILVVGSGLGVKGTAGGGAYCASKAGARILTQVLSAELVPDGIAVNEFIPGPVRTELTRPLWETGKGVFGLQEWIKEPEDVVSYVLNILDNDPKASPSGQTFSLTRRVL